MFASAWISYSAIHWASLQLRCTYFVIWHSWCIKDTNSAALCVFSHSSTTLLRPAMDPLCSGLSSKLDMICLEREPNHSNAYYLQKKNRQCRHYWHRLGKDFVFFAPPNGCRDTQHSIWRTKEERLFSGDQVVGRQRPAHHQEHCSDNFGVVFNVQWLVLSVKFWLRIWLHVGLIFSWVLCQ